jgi:hypothetical protein
MSAGPGTIGFTATPIPTTGNPAGALKRAGIKADLVWDLSGAPTVAGGQRDQLDPF